MADPAAQDGAEAPAEVAWRCRCGALRLRVRTRSGNRAVCYCADCRGMARHLGADHVVDEAGGVELFQTVPDRLTLESGGAHLACLRMTSRGPLRWYADCCDTPVAFTPTRRGMAQVSLVADGLGRTEHLGRVLARYHASSATAPVGDTTGSVAGAVAGLMLRSFGARMAGRHTETPFFDAPGRPVAEPHLLDADQRAAAHAGG